MTRFMNCLNRDIMDRFEVHHYVQIEKLMHKAIMFEEQLKRRRYKPSYGATLQEGWKDQRIQMILQA